MKILRWSFSGWILVPTLLLAGPPQIENAHFEGLSLQGDLEGVVATWSESSSEPTWLGWHVPMADGDQVLCCGSGADWRRRGRVCELEGTHRHFVFSSRRDFTSLPPGENLVVLLRAAGGHLDDLQIFSEGCPLDANGRKMIWLEGVDPDDSVALLGELVGGTQPADRTGRLADEALMALALHAAPAAAESLISAAESNPSSEIRGEALFWLAHTGTERAAEVILAALQRDADRDVREEAVFALSQLPDGRGVPMLLAIAQDPDRASAIRQEAFFWFVQEGDDQALDLIAEILNPESG